MSLSADERKAIVALKLSKSENAYSDMLKNFEFGMYSTAANRLYYSLFYASCALLVNDGYEAHTHSGCLTLINLHYIKEQKIPLDFSKLLRNVFRLRQDSDYDDYFSIEAEDLQKFIVPSKKYIELVKNLIFKKG